MKEDENGEKGLIIAKGRKMTKNNGREKKGVQIENNWKDKKNETGQKSIKIYEK